MHNKRLAIGLLLLACATSSVAQAPTTKPPPTIAPVPEDSEKPELKRRALPADTFKPSEAISEDFPVPFPVDI